MKRLIGRTDMEDAFKRLDKLTHEEARMAVAQNLKATHNVDQRVRGVADTVEAVGDRVAGVDDRVAAVNNCVACVDDKVTNVDDRVKVFGEKIAEVIHGASTTFDRSPMQCLNPTPLRWKGSKGGHATNSE
jgi:hypothetical protein